MSFTSSIYDQGFVLDINYIEFYLHSFASIDITPCKPKKLHYFKLVFGVDASAPIWRRKTQRAGFGTNVNQSEHLYRSHCIIISIK